MSDRVGQMQNQKLDHALSTWVPSDPSTGAGAFQALMVKKRPVPPRFKVKDTSPFVARIDN